MKILIIDKHALFRDGLRLLLQQSHKGFDEILEADSFYLGLQITDQHQDIDLVLLETKSPGCNGLNSVERFHRRFPGVPLVVVSSEESSQLINDVIGKGARGFVCKSSCGNILLNALMHVLDGGVFIPPQMIAQSGVKFDDYAAGQGGPRSATGRLTSRQMQVLGYLANGFSNKEIASAMCLAEGTVKVHTASIFQALRVNNRIEAKKVAEAAGLLDIKPMHACA